MHVHNLRLQSSYLRGTYALISFFSNINGDKLCREASVKNIDGKTQWQDIIISEIAAGKTNQLCRFYATSNNQF